jgi:hypothetical protein
VKVSGFACLASRLWTGREWISFGSPGWKANPGSLLALTDRFGLEAVAGAASRLRVGRSRSLGIGRLRNRVEHGRLGGGSGRFKLWLLHGFSSSLLRLDQLGYRNHLLRFDGLFTLLLLRRRCEERYLDC